MAVVLLPSHRMHAVVTGVSGFIGGHLAAELIARGYRVTGIDRAPRSHAETHCHVTLDLANSPKITGLGQILASADVIYHLAARPGVRDCPPRLADLRHRDNVIATANVLAAAPPDTHVVAASSSSVYGGALLGNDGLTPSKESDSVRPVGGYARSKVRMEELCAHHRDRGGSITVVRPFTVAGERQRIDMAFAIWLDALRQGKPIRIFGSGERSRDITDVRHVVQGLIRAAERRVAGTVNLGTGVGHRLSDMARALIDVTGLDGTVVYTPVATGDVSATLADTALCERLLGFVPVTDLHSVLERLVSAAPAPVLAIS